MLFYCWFTIELHKLLFYLYYVFIYSNFVLSIDETSLRVYLWRMKLHLF